MTDIKPHDLPVSSRLLKLEAAIQKMQADYDMRNAVIDDNFEAIHKSIENICETVLSKKPKKTRSTEGFKRFGADSWVDIKGNRIVPPWEKEEK